MYSDKIARFYKKTQRYHLSALFLLTLSLFNILSIVLSNFGSAFTSELISNNIEIAKKIDGTDRVEATIKSNNDNSSWFSLNQYHIGRFASLYENNSIYLDYSAIAADTFKLDEDNLDVVDEPLKIYGFASEKNSSAPLGVKVVRGQYVKYDSTGNDSADSNPCLISTSYAKTLMNIYGITDQDNLIGRLVYQEKLSIPLYISGICEDSFLSNDYSSDENLFIIANYICFSARFNGEQIKLKLLNQYYTNYSLFNYLFRYICPIEGNSTLNISFDENEWIIEEALAVAEGSIDDFSSMFYIFLGLFFVAGYCYCILQNRNKRFFKKQENSANQIEQIIYLFLFFALSLSISYFINHAYLFSIHISTRLSSSALYSVTYLLLFIFGFLLSRIIQNNLQSKKKAILPL